MCKPLNDLKEAILSDTKLTRIALCMHACPDPDCIGSALGLAKVLKHWNPDIKCTYIYEGEISHPQNKTLINLLNINLTNANEIEDIQNKFDYFISLDTTPERCLTNCDEEIEYLMAIDHHRAETNSARIIDIRQVGATSSIIWEYLQKEGIVFHEDNDEDTFIATALVFGIKTDTNDLVSENVTALDYKAVEDLMIHADRSKIQLIKNYPIPSYQFELESKLNEEGNIKVTKGIFVGGVGYITATKRDALPTMATLRARMEGVDTAFVFGIVGDHIEVSVRSQGVSIDVNTLCQQIFGKEYAGGKMGSGAAKVPLGFIGVNATADAEVKKKTWEAIKAIVIDKVFHVMEGNN
jgi:nanoRNase/pAp phosphatase (c-di-AMP/oligoRNAs hydrolase)